MDSGKSDVGEGECSTERSCHPGFRVVPEEGIQNQHPERTGECIDVSESLFPYAW